MALLGYVIFASAMVLQVAARQTSYLQQPAPGSVLKGSPSHLLADIGIASLLALNSILISLNMTFGVAALLLCIVGLLWKAQAPMWQIARRCYQRRRLYMASFFRKLCGHTHEPASLAVRGKSRQQSSFCHDAHDWHEALANGCMMPVDVAEYQLSPEVSHHVQRLLIDRWEYLLMNSYLEPVPEHECLQFEEEEEEEEEVEEDSELCLPDTRLSDDQLTRSVTVF